MLDPVVRTALDGYILEVRPTLPMTVTQVALDLKILAWFAGWIVQPLAVFRLPVRSARLPEFPEMRAELETPLGRYLSVEHAG